ncbi:MAG TPA: PEP/pyruvate-binding domain-containing protein [Pseudonocardia sp.]|nr:PEP/pyruvate-binding domain-containing protein [Pseudonocardia sp.]
MLCRDPAIVGGKAANLGRTAAAGLPVPPAFVVTARAYREFVAHDGLGTRIAEQLAGLDTGDPDDLSARAGRIRELVIATAVPETAESAIRAGYDELTATHGTEFVAVRSSGTAEDLAGASFAGQHDTYLDVRGGDDVLDAVRRCWASLWTDRAVAYRSQRGFDHGLAGDGAVDGGGVALPVVVQAMVAADCSGVLFTADPMTGAVDRYVVNAGWGLGEGVVSGVLEPDQIVLDRATLEPVERTLGAKEVRVVRDPDTGSGTVTETTPADLRARYAVDDVQLRQLARLGRRVTEYYGGWPQDIEWAFTGSGAEARLHLLQTREVTGVDLSWDSDLDDWKQTDPPAPDTLWSNVWAREIWCGRITPLMYSIRGEALTAAHTYSANMWGFPEVGRLPLFKYRRGTVYFNSRTDYLNHLNTVPPILRTGAVMPFVPPTWFADLEQQPFDWARFVKFFIRLRMIDKVTAPYAWMKNAFFKEEHQKEYFAGLPIEEIRELSDRELKDYAQLTVTKQAREYTDAYTGLFVHVPLASAAMIWFLGQYYRGTNQMIFTDLVTGLPQRTLTQSANLAQLALADTIKADPELRKAYDDHPGAAFFEVVAADARFAAFDEQYRRFVADYGHRGHADRDIWYDRRCENPGLDYDALGSLMLAEGVDHEATERRLIAQREAAADEVIDGLRRQPLAAVKIEAFKLLHDYLLRFFTWRDNERNHADRGTLAKKRAFAEIGRRLVERGVLTSGPADRKDEDFYYLSKDELFRLLEGDAGRVSIDRATTTEERSEAGIDHQHGVPTDPRVLRAKITGRRRNCDRVNAEWHPPMYLEGERAVELTVPGEPAPELPEGTLRGLGTSRGRATGTARVIGTQAQLGTLARGDVLVTNATDPGWTPAFLLISGLVLETGGMLAHGSCISREYGIPAVVIPGAMSLIENGARITVSGDTGEVMIEPPGQHEQRGRTEEPANG